MIKKLLEQLDYGLFAELSLALFLLVFISVVIRTLLTRSAITAQQSLIVLNDSVEEPHE